MEDRRKQILKGIAGGVAVVAVIAALALDVGGGSAVETDSRSPVELVVPEKDGVGTSPSRTTNGGSAPAPASTGAGSDSSGGSAPADEPAGTPEPDHAEECEPPLQPAPGGGCMWVDPGPDEDPDDGGNGGGGGPYPQGNKHTYDQGDQKLAHDEGGSGGQPTPPPPGHGEGAYDNCRAKKSQQAC